LIAIIPYLLTPYSHKAEVAKAIIDNQNLLMTIKVTVLSNIFSVTAMFLSRPVSAFLYTLLSIGIFLRYLFKNKESAVFSGQTFMIKWLFALLGFILLLSISTFLMIFNTFVLDSHNLFHTTNLLQILSAIGLTGLLVSPFFSPNILYGLPRIDENIAKSVLPSEPGQEKKPSEQNFESSYLLLIEEKIKSSICESQPYLQPDLNLIKFAACLQIPPHHIAYYFREVKKQTFNDFRNECRVNHAKKMIIEGKAESLTLEAIALSSGFTTRNTFFTAFKKVEGISPGAFAGKFNPRLT